MKLATKIRSLAAESAFYGEGGVYRLSTPFSEGGPMGGIVDIRNCILTSGANGVLVKVKDISQWYDVTTSPKTLLEILNYTVVDRQSRQIRLATI